jgi:hypothetical protein
MGGLGSGRRYRKKTLTTHMFSLDIRLLHRKGLLDPGNTFRLEYAKDGRFVVNVRVWDDETVELQYITSANGEREDISYAVPLEWTRCYFGGRRPWFICPVSGCERRVAILHGGRIFSCRHCHGLAYASQRENPVWRAHRRARKLEICLGWDKNKDGRPKGMHRRTFEKLKCEYEQYNTVAWIGLSAELERFEMFGQNVL